MGIFSTVSEVNKNSKNFKLWEEKQRLETAQREKLYETNDYTEEELEKAKALGENIIGAIDVMDNHSESVAENVETATAPIVGAAPFLGGALGAWGSIKYLVNPAYKKIDEIKSTFFEKEDAKKLYTKIRYSLQNQDSTLAYNFSFTKKNHIKKIKDSGLRKQAEDLYKKYTKTVAPSRKKIFAAIGITIGTVVLSFVGSIIAATNLQVRSSRVARFQARRELEDPKNFVNYTPEQIAKAKADMMEDKTQKKEKSKIRSGKHLDENDKKPKLKQGFWGSLIGIIRDNKAYKTAKIQDRDESKIVTRELSEEEIIQAEKDKEIIQRTVRVINNEAEKNSENMETAANVLIGGTPLLGLAVGSLTSWILNKTGIVDKKIEKIINKSASEDTKNLLNKYKEANNNKNLRGISGLVKKLGLYGDYVSSMMNDLEVSAKKSNTHVKASDYIKRGATAVLTNSKGRNWIFGLIGSAVTGMVGLVLGLKLQKSAARAGRYTAKVELEKDPRNFIGYTEEEYGQVNDVKPVRKESRFKEVVLFIPRVLKQYRNYNQYKKHEFEEKQELRKYLHKQDVTEDQLIEAKNLQRKVFNTFEKVDENSQKYSESMEATIEIAQPFVVFGGYIAMCIPALLAIRGIYKVKENPAKIVEKVSGWMKNSSKLVNSKLSRKYLDGVASNIPAKTAEVTLQNKPVGLIMNGIDLKNDGAIIILQKAFKNLKLSPNELRKLNDHEIRNKVYLVGAELKKSLKEDSNLCKLLDNIMKLPAESQIDTLDMVLNPQNIGKIAPESYKKILEAFSPYIESSKSLIATLQKCIPIDALKQMLGTISTESLDPSLTKSINNLKSVINRLESENIVDTLVSQQTMQKFVHDIGEITSTIKKRSPQLKENPLIQRFLENCEIPLSNDVLNALKSLPNVIENPSQMKNIIEQIHNGLKAESLDSSVKLNEVVDFPNKLKKLNLRTTLLSFVEKPSDFVKKFKSSINKASEEEFNKIISNNPILKNIHGLDKDCLIKILENLEKSVDNIPKDELKKILDSILETFNKNPDEFINLVKKGNLKNILLTPELQNLLIVTGISIPTLTIIVTYAIESWLAGLELKAGRLGVMKSLEDLEDPRYYANIEPVQD